MIEGMYVERDRWLQRQPAGRKLGVLLVAGTLLFFVKQPGLLALGVLLAAVLLGTSGAGWRGVLKQVKGLSWLWLAVVVAAALLQDWFVALESGLRLAALMGLALAVSLTTRTRDFIAAVEAGLQPLGRWGWIRPDRVAFALALTLRFVPEFQRQWHAIREAQAARGIRAHPVTMVVPLVLAVLRTADAIVEALEARGWE